MILARQGTIDLCASTPGGHEMARGWPPPTLAQVPTLCTRRVGDRAHAGILGRRDGLASFARYRDGRDAPPSMDPIACGCSGACTSVLLRRTPPVQRSTRGPPAPHSRGDPARRGADRGGARNHGSAAGPGTHVPFAPAARSGHAVRGRPGIAPLLLDVSMPHPAGHDLARRSPQDCRDRSRSAALQRFRSRAVPLVRRHGEVGVCA